MSDKIEVPEAGKLAMRREGDKWTAYHQHPNGYREFLCSISIPVLEALQIRDEYREFSETIFVNYLEYLTGVKLVTGEESKAPESERSGTA